MGNFLGQFSYPTIHSWMAIEAEIPLCSVSIDLSRMEYASKSHLSLYRKLLTLRKNIRVQAWKTSLVLSMLRNHWDLCHAKQSWKSLKSSRCILPSLIWQDLVGLKNWLWSFTSSLTNRWDQMTVLYTVPYYPAFTCMHLYTKQPIFQHNQVVSYISACTELPGDMCMYHYLKKMHHHLKPSKTGEGKKV